MALIVRPPRDDVELVVCQEIEAAAGRLFAEIGLHEIAAAPPDDLATLQVHQERGTIWVAVLGDEVVGYAMASVVDGEGHLDQVSVRPEHGRRGVGTALLDRAGAWAVERGYHAMTLTTFRDVAWNGPYYLKVGFQPLAEADLGPELRAIRDRERADGLDVLPRQAMRRLFT
jgi:GNAT superfamily N-acetyltransferase